MLTQNIDRFLDRSGVVPTRTVRSRDKYVVDFSRYLSQTQTGDIRPIPVLQSEQTSTKPSKEGAQSVYLAAVWDVVLQQRESQEFFVNWVQQQALQYGDQTWFQDAIQLTLQNDALEITRALVASALKMYPESHIFHEYERTLAPPKVLQTGTRAGRDYSKSMHWLSDHSHEYVGQWVALRDGELIATSLTRLGLIEKIGDLHQDPGVLLSRIPAT